MRIALRPEIGETFEYQGVTINPHELFERYNSSPHGIYHQQQVPRFAQAKIGYGYEPYSEFIEDLGPDVHPTLHMLYTHDAIIVPLLQEQRKHLFVPHFSAKREAELRTTGILHDIGECTEPSLESALGFMPSGDVKYGTYALGHKEREEKIRNYLYGLYFSDLPEQLLKRVDEIDGQRGKPKMVEPFEVSERLGYFITARRAAERVINAEQNRMSDERTAQLGRLALIVANGHYGYLRSKQNRYPFVKRKLDELMLVK